jgi:hypothetical protein
MFRPVGETIEVSIPERERFLISGLPGLLEGVEEGGDPAFAVLNRSAYREDEAASSEFSRLVEDDTAALRTADRAILADAGRGPMTLTRDEGLGLLRALNEARLVVAARSGVIDDGPGWEDRIPVDPDVAALAWLGYLESELLQALSSPV